MTTTLLLKTSFYTLLTADAYGASHLRAKKAYEMQKYRRSFLFKVLEYKSALRLTSSCLTLPQRTLLPFLMLPLALETFLLLKKEKRTTLHYLSSHLLPLTITISAIALLFLRHSFLGGAILLPLLYHKSIEAGIIAPRFSRKIACWITCIKAVHLTCIPFLPLRLLGCALLIYTLKAMHFFTYFQQSHRTNLQTEDHDLSSVIHSAFTL